MDLDAARTLAHSLLDEHELTGKGWTFHFDNAKQRMGETIFLTRKITISRPYTETADEAHVRDTILHEIAHALAGYEAGHGPAWRAIAISIGATPAARARNPYWDRQMKALKDRALADARSFPAATPAPEAYRLGDRVVLASTQRSETPTVLVIFRSTRSGHYRAIDESNGREWRVRSTDVIPHVAATQGSMVAA